MMSTCQHKQQRRMVRLNLHSSAHSSRTQTHAHNTREKERARERETARTHTIELLSIVWYARKCDARTHDGFELDSRVDEERGYKDHSGEQPERVAVETVRNEIGR